MINQFMHTDIQQFVSEGNLKEIKEIIRQSHHEDVASMISRLENVHDKVVVYRLVPTSKSLDVFESLDPEEQQQILSELSNVASKRLLNEMAPDERTELLEELPATLVKKFINMLSIEERRMAVAILGYPENSAGRLITSEFVQLYEFMSVQDAFEHIRKVGLNKETIYHCYVLDAEKRLIGVVSLRTLVVSSPEEKIKTLMDTEVISVNVKTDQEEAAHIFQKYDLISLPVVDNQNRLVGIVTFDDFVDVLEEEATEDFERMAAVLPVDKPYLDTKMHDMVWKRSVWLLILVALESISGLVLAHYEPIISHMIALTFFLPVLIGTAGNAGTQSATLIIRGLATNEIRVSDFFRVVLKESAIGVLMGLVLAVFGVARAFLQQGNWPLSFSVGIAMGLTIVISTTVGASLPIIFRKFKIDPALMSGPMITTIVDIAGIAIYFEIATLLLTKVL